MFDVAIWTDTLASESINGTSGFNFQAISPGIDANDQHFIKNNMLFQRRVTWPAERELDHPVSFAYHRNEDGRMFFSRGIPTGATNNGRPGNSLTQIIATDDPDDLAGEIPAQLFGAQDWSLQKATGQELKPWLTPLDVVDSFAPEGLHQFVTEYSFLRDNFSRIVAMIHDAGQKQKKTIIYTSNADIAQRLIAAASLLLSRPAAMEMSICGLVAEPFTTKADVVVASADFGPLASAATVQSVANLIDLDSETLTPVDVSSAIELKAQWFVAQGAAALEAISVLSAWEELLGETLAIPAVELAIFGELSSDDRPERRWDIAIRALEKLSVDHHEDEIFNYGDPLVDVALASYQVRSPAQAGLIARVVCALYCADAPDLATWLLANALETVAASPQLAAALSAGLTALPLSPGFQWVDAEAHAAAAQGIRQVLHHTAIPDIWRILHLASVAEVAIGAAEADREIDAFSRWWCAHPTAIDLDTPWELRHEVVRRLPVRIAEACSENRRDIHDAVQHGKWDWLGVSPADSATPVVRADDGTVDAYYNQLAPWRAGLKLVHGSSAKDIAEALAAARLLPGLILRLLGERFNFGQYPFVLHAWLQSQRYVSPEADALVNEQLRVALQTQLDCGALDPVFGELTHANLQSAAATHRLVSDANYARSMVQRWLAQSEGPLPQPIKRPRNARPAPPEIGRILKLKPGQEELVSAFLPLWLPWLQQIGWSGHHQLAEAVAQLRPKTVLNALRQRLKRACEPEQIPGYLNWAAEVKNGDFPKLRRIANEYLETLLDSRAGRKKAQELAETGQLSPLAAALVASEVEARRGFTNKLKANLGMRKTKQGKG